MENRSSHAAILKAGLMDFRIITAMGRNEHVPLHRIYRHPCPDWLSVGMRIPGRQGGAEMIRRRVMDAFIIIWTILVLGIVQ